jgi:hypothetical protein
VRDERVLANSTVAGYVSGTSNLRARDDWVMDSLAGDKFLVWNPRNRRARSATMDDGGRMPFGYGRIADSSHPLQLRESFRFPLA